MLNIAAIFIIWTVSLVVGVILLIAGSESANAVWVIHSVMFAALLILDEIKKLMDDTYE